MVLDKNGNPFAAYSYDAWGNPLGQGNISEGIWAQATTQGATEVLSLETATMIAKRQPLRYAGYCLDSESGMYYLSARHYDPETRQFLSKDLSRNDGEQSAYQYCLGNPIANVDPTGYAVMREIDRPRTPEERADSRNRVLAARAKWYADHSQSTAGKVFGWMNKYLNPANAWKNIPSYVINKVSPAYGLAYDWAMGTGSRDRYFSAFTKATQQMMNSSSVQANWERFKQGGCVDMPFGYDTDDAGREFIKDPLSSTRGKAELLLFPIGKMISLLNNQPAMVNGYDGAAMHNNGDGTATVTIINDTGLASLSSYLDYIPGMHKLGDFPWEEGPGSTVTQTYQWTWPLSYNGGSE